MSLGRSMLATLAVTISGCFPLFPCEHPAQRLTVEGTATQGSDPISLENVSIEINLLADDEAIGGGITSPEFNDDVGEFRDADGDFGVVAGGLEMGRVCQGPFAPPPEYPPPLRPDRIEFVITRGDCEQRVMVEINEDTVVDPTFPDEVLELKEPLEVPPCEQAGP